MKYGVLFLIFMQSTCLLNACRNDYYKAVEYAYSDETRYELATKDAEPLDACKLSCLQDARCAAANFNSMMYACTLLSKASNILTTNDNYSYIALSSEPFVNAGDSECFVWADPPDGDLDAFDERGNPVTHSNPDGGYIALAKIDFGQPGKTAGFYHANSSVGYFTLNNPGAGPEATPLSSKTHQTTEHAAF